MSRIKAGLDLAVELKEEEQLEEIQTEPTEETVEEFQEESLEDTIAEIDESFDLALKAFTEGSDNLEALKAEKKKIIKQMDDITADGGTVPFGDPLNSRLKKINAKIKQASGKVSEGIWGDFKRDFFGEPRAGTAGKYFNHLAQKYAGSNRTLSAYYSIMAGKTPSNIDDPEKFKHDVENNIPLKMQIDRDLKDAKMSAQMNEINEPVVENIKTEHNLIANILKKYGWEATSEGKSPGVLVKVYTNPDFPDETINQYFSPRGRLARWNHIRETDGEYLKIAIGSAELKKYMRKLNQMNELKEPVDYHDDDPEEYLKTLNPKTVKKQYAKTLPKGHTNLYKKFKQLKEISDEDDGNLYTFRVLCTLKDYGHTMVSKRGEDIMKTVRVTAGTSNEAINKAKRHYKMKGYEVMDAEVVGKLSASGEQVNEGYEDRVQDVARRVKSQLNYPVSKEQLERTIRSMAYDVVDMKVPSAAKDFLKDVYKAVKPHVKWAKKTAPAKPKINLQAVGNMVMDAIGRSFPDGDPIDIIVPRLRKAGINTDAGVDKLLDKALKSIGYNGGYNNTLADFWDEMKSQHDFDKSHGHAPPYELGDKNPWRIRESATGASGSVDLKKLGNMVMDAIGQSYPDGDPIDFIIPNLRKMGIDPNNVEPLLDKALAAIGYEDGYYETLADFWDNMNAENPDEAGDENPWRIRESNIPEAKKGTFMSGVKAKAAAARAARIAAAKKAFKKVTWDQFEGLASDSSDYEETTANGHRIWVIWNGPNCIGSFYTKEGYGTYNPNFKGDDVSYNESDPYYPQSMMEAGGSANPKDKVTLDIPLLIRLLEYAREDAKTDMDLHDLTEKLIAMGSEGGRTLSMKDYDQLVQHADTTDEPTKIDENYGALTTELAAKEFHDEVATIMTSLANKYKSQTKPESNIPSAPNTQTMRATVGGMIQYSPNQVTHENGFTREYLDFLKIGGGVDMGVKRSMRAELAKALQHVVSGFAAEPGTTIKTSDGYIFTYDEAYGTNWGGFGFKVRKPSVNEAKNPAMHKAKLIAKMQKNAPSFKAAMAKKDKDKEEVKENNRSNRLDDLYDREMRKLDKELEAGHITQAEYNKQARNLNRELEDEDNEQLNEVYVIHKVKGNSSTQLPKISFKTKKEAKSHVDDRMAKRSEYDKEQGIKFEYRKNKMGGLKPERIEAAKKIGKK